MCCIGASQEAIRDVAESGWTLLPQYELLRSGQWRNLSKMEGLQEFKCGLCANANVTAGAGGDITDCNFSAIFWSKKIP
jgi:hypothetical protein